MKVNNLYIQDTIVASASAAGIGGINIIRLSGVHTEKIIKIILGKIPPSRVATHTKFYDQEKNVLDVGIAIYYPNPDSFTGESVLELHAHGGRFIGKNIINSIIDMGARRAEPGEFSKRAYLNGKIDLIQAEAIADLISSGTERSAIAALQSLSGVFSDAVSSLEKKLIKLRLYVEAAIDFPDEEIDFLSDKGLSDLVDNCEKSLNDLFHKTTYGQILNDGLKIAIVGLPNAGKSSLINLISGQETAIVTDIAGTTRDILKAQVDIDGLSLEFYDTAGLRDDPDSIEAEGIRRTNNIIEESDVILWVHDLSLQPTIEQNLEVNVPLIKVFNKIDLIQNLKKNIQGIYISANTGEGLEDLYDAIKQSVKYESAGDGAFSARMRHKDAIKNAINHFSLGKKALIHEHAGEIFAEEIKLCQAALHEMTGVIDSDDLLGRIFSEFCIGK